MKYRLIEWGEYELTVSSLVTFIAVLMVMFAISRGLRGAIYRVTKLEDSKKFSISKLSNYVIGFFTILIGMNVLGINISILTAGSAALLVGVGFGLQNLFNDFVSGIILLVDATLKVGDVIEVNGMIYRVEQINFRTTTVVGRNENFVIMPNSQLTANNLINWTHSGVSSRFRVDIGVDYGTDVPTIMNILKVAASKHTKVLPTPEPFVRFEDYGDSALQFALYFFTNDVFRVENIKSELRIEIYEEIKRQGITIPFPQRVVHVQPS